jgi:membrane associated rhomboid family serine protease
MWRPPDVDPDRIPAAPLLVALRNPRVIAFVTVWFAINLIFGVGSLPIFGADQSVAWQAHVGGFLAGLLLFAAFDPVPRPTDSESAPTTH